MANENTQSPGVTEAELNRFSHPARQPNMPSDLKQIIDVQERLASFEIEMKEEQKFDGWEMGIYLLVGANYCLNLLFLLLGVFKKTPKNQKNLKINLLACAHLMANVMEVMDQILDETGDDTFGMTCRLVPTNDLQEKPDWQFSTTPPMGWKYMKKKLE